MVLTGYRHLQMPYLVAYLMPLPTFPFSPNKDKNELIHICWFFTPAYSWLSIATVRLLVTLVLTLFLLRNL